MNHDFADADLRATWTEAPTGDIAESVLDPSQVSKSLGPTVVPQSSSFGQRHPSSENVAHRDPSNGARTDMRNADNGLGAEVLSIHHVGIAVRSIDEAMGFYGHQLGLEIVDQLTLPDRELKVVFIKAGPTLLELLEPTDSSGTVARFLEKRGPGLHHLCFGTPDIESHLRELQEKGVELIDPIARPGAHGDVAFLHPASAYGVLVELIQPRTTSADDRSA